MLKTKVNECHPARFGIATCSPHLFQKHIFLNVMLSSLTLNVLLLFSRTLCITLSNEGDAVTIDTCRTLDNGYPHDGRADKNPYPHDRRADKDSYPHDSNNQCIILGYSYPSR